MTENNQTTEDSASELKVPLFGSWKRAYAFIILLFLIQVVAYSILTDRVS